MKRAVYILLFFSLLACSASAFADEQTDQETSRYDPAQGVRKLGVTHNIASDRKIENVGGLYEPEGLDKYMKRRFDDLETKISAIEAQSKRTEEKIDQMLEAGKRREPQMQQQPQQPVQGQRNVLQSSPRPSPTPRNIFR